MTGNRKHGFMRSSKAGRNDFGMAQSFFCDACEKEHGQSVERTGLKHFIGSDVLICDRKYFQMKDAESKAQSNTSKAISKLKRLKSKIGLADDKGRKHRIDFIATVLIHQLKDELNSYQLFDEHGIGERDFDTCFEMHDGDLVVHGLVALAKKNYWLKANMKKAFGPACFNDWVATYKNVEANAITAQTNGSEGQLALTL
ncbi:hypothetical protein BM525_19460 (plasmid) [Alteromonas mediterranea]|uniref:Uncharacterized protein n=1 Tax=Alteromonas mediterranea TaxID=314275 RepID=A0AAC9JHG1_9ALTE|nr:hypothetical protein [Alteromonas mediterranea]APD92062.1 hypothetical protein BM524_19265 [Alteromonas mediterranea]APD99916.1 hypothetical protein BM525_19460 [Alteromonas mediterranea]